MKNKKVTIIIAVVAIIAIMTAILYYCFNKKNPNTQNSIEEALAQLSLEYDEFDEDDTWDESTATKITLKNTEIQITGNGASKDGKNVKITSAGTYYITGTLDDGTIIIDAGKDDNIKLVLDNAKILCSDSSAIYVKQDNKTAIILAEGSTNTIIDGSNYTFENSEDDEPNAAIFSKDNIIINGTGTLNIEANYEDGIASKDNIKIINGNINITANDDGIRGKDYVAIKDGKINIVSKSDGIKSTNSEEADKGYIVIEGGEININAGDDGIHANTKLVINAGKINITKSYEGIESANIIINGGTIKLVASDDGINAAGGVNSSTTNSGAGQNRGMESTTTGTATINGGYIYVNADGDGIDINGSCYINGGTIIVNGPTNNGNGALDYDGELKMTGGTLIAAGSSGMLQTVSNSSTQYCISTVFTTSQNANTLVNISDSTGNNIITFAPCKTYQAIVVCSPDLQKGKSYTISTGGTSTGTSENGLYTDGKYIGGTTVSTVTLSNIVTSIGRSSGMGMQPGRR